MATSTSTTRTARTPEDRKSVFMGSIWMVVISLVLFFLPILNGLIGGLVGGYMVRGVGRALAAAILPAIVVAVGLWILLAVLDLPVVGFLAGVAIGLWILFSDLGLLLGAALGGALGDAKAPRRIEA